LHAFGGTPAIVYSGDPDLVLTGAGNGSFFKNFSGAGSLIKRGPGMWTIGENTSHTGDTVIEQGVLRMRHPNFSDTAAVRISRGAMLDLWHYHGDAVGALVLDGVTMPAGTYNQSTHPQYFLGRGSLVVGGPAMTGTRPLTYWLGNTSRSDIISSMEVCLDYFNKYGRFSGNIQVRYDSNVPTAQASQGGPITFGGSISSRTAMHEMCHVQGTGTAWQWDYNRSGGQWTGAAVNLLVRQFNDSTSVMGCDPAHFWPYGLNYPSEDSEDTRRIQPMMVEAFRKDMGIGWSPPSIGTIPDQTVATNLSTGAVAFTTSSDVTALTASSSNPALVPASNIAISGSGTSRFITVTPAANQTGTATIYVIATDGLDTVSTTFTVTVGGATTAYVWANGTGPWDAVTPNWTGAGTLWPNSGSDHAVITGPAATLNVASGISAGEVTFNTDATLQGSPLTLAGTSPVVHVLDGVTVQAGAQLAGSSGLEKDGLGTLVLSGGQVYLGATTVTEGTLQLGDGTTNATVAGTISNAANLTWNPPADLTFTNVITGTGGVTQSSARTVTLNASNTFTGLTDVTTGTLVIRGGHASAQHAIDEGAELVFDTSSGSKNYPSTTFSGLGTLVKEGSNNLYWGSGAATFALPAGSLIDVRSGTFIGGSNANENWSSNESDLNIEAGATFDGVEANVRINRLTGSGTLKTGYNGAGYSNFTIGVANGSSTFDGTIADRSSSGVIRKIGTGTITFTNANSYTGATSISDTAGALRISHGSALGTSAGGVFITGGTSSAALELSGGITVAGESIRFDGRSTSSAHLRNHSGDNTWTGTISTNVGGSNYNIESASGMLTISGSLSNSQSGTRYWQLLGSGDGIVSGVIGAGSNPSGATVEKDGSGTWKLSAANLYGGGTTVNGGTLVADTSGTLGTGNLTVNTGAVCDLRNASGALSDAASVYLNGSGKLAIASGVAELVARLFVDDIEQPAGVYTSTSGFVTGAGSLVVTDGTVVLTPAEQWRQTYFGTTENTGNAADDQDPDHDGYVNLLERAFGLNPLGHDATGRPFIDTTGGGFALVFQQSRAATDLTLVVELSPDLGTSSWRDAILAPAPNADGTLELIDDTPPDVRIHRFTVTGTADRSFYRIRIQP
ncbi:MAG: autotransporter-associated beta strand repeat-containing protein, partial [Verrucomicrobiae bacterium]|nr:autotransporter-associated beta strand repeat-containing protein [Verrucomicrobiae bacterium]